MSVEDAFQAPRPLRVMIAQAGSDGHDRGAKVIARAFRDAGAEVVCTELLQAPERIVRIALEQDVDAVGLSVLSDAHIALFSPVLERLRAEGAQDIVFFGAGMISEKDAIDLKRLGAEGFFASGAPLSDIIAFVQDACGKRRSFIG